MKLVAFDGDNTLWTPMSGVCISDRTATDSVGWPHFTFAPSTDDPLMISRDDSAQFAIRPEAREVLAELRRRGVLVGVVSYNHETNVRRVLEAGGLSAFVDYVVAEWHTEKDRMLDKMLAAAREEGYPLDPQDVILIDDDPEGIYRGQCGRMGVGFRCFGDEMSDLREVLTERTED